MKKILVVFSFVILLASCKSTTTYTVSFHPNANVHISFVEVQYVNEGDSVLEPTIPLNEGHTFSGWYTDSTLLVPYDFSRTVSSDIELHAKWDINDYAIIVFDKNGDVLQNSSYTYGAPITDFTFPTDTDVPGYVFEGWDTEVPDTMPGNDVEVHPIYSLIQFRHIYIDPIISDEISIVVEVGSDLELPALNDLPGFTFEGWYLDSLYVLPFELTVMPDEDIYVYAKWQVVEYTIDFYDYDNNLLSSINVAYGTDLSTVDTPTPPEITGMTFTGWGATFTGLMPAEDLSFTAEYSANE